MRKIDFKKDKAKKLFVFFLAAYLTNFFWESWHSSYLYAGHIFRMDGVVLMSYASLIDAALLLAVFWLGMAVWRDFYWFERMDWKKYLCFIITALAIAVFIEVRAIYFLGRWSYNGYMPTVFGIGLSPLLQLSLTGLLSLYLIRQLRR